MDQGTESESEEHVPFYEEGCFLEKQSYVETDSTFSGEANAGQHR